MFAGVAATRIIVESQVTGDVLTEASIQFDNIGEDVVPAADNIWDLGSEAMTWGEVHQNIAFINVISSSPRPNSNNTRDFGSAAFNWKTIFTNDLGGGAGALLFAGLIMGEG